MSDEASRFVFGDTAISAIEEPSKRRFFRRRRAKRKMPLSHCENCGAALTGRFCSQCGQPAIDYRRSFRHVIVDVLDSFLNWDSKFFASIGLLIIRPWHLTNQFVAGKRVRYLHPLRLYLLGSILFFFAVTYWAKSVHLNTKNLTAQQRAEVEADLKDEDLPPAVRGKIEKALHGHPASQASVVPAEPSTPPVPANSATAAPKAESSTAQPSGQNEIEKAIKGAQNEDRPLFQFGSDKPRTLFEKWLEQRAREKFGENGTNAQLFLVSMINNLPYMMLCSIPLFALILKVLYIRRHIFYIDHLIYALHIHTFAYVAVILIGLTTIGLHHIGAHVLGNWLIALLWFAFAMQIFLSIRRVYRQGWIKSFVKFWLGGMFYVMVLIMGFVATFFITLAAP